jgi:FG-GAP repeat
MRSTNLRNNPHNTHIRELEMTQTNAWPNFALRCVTLSAALLAAGCGGGSDTQPPVVVALPDVQNFNVTPRAAGIGKLALEWPATGGATFYRVLQRSSAGGEFAVVADSLNATSFSAQLPVHLTDWASLAFKIEACNTAGCVESQTAGLLDLAAQLIGFVKASNPEAGDLFGRKLVLSSDGNTLAVGAMGEDGDNATDAPNNNAPDAGAVYVFIRSGETWVQEARLKAAVVDPGDSFGASLALSADGSRLVVGAPGEDSGLLGPDAADDNNLPGAGAAYVFARQASASAQRAGHSLRVPSTWAQEAFLKPTSRQSNGRFGYSVGISDDGRSVAVGSIRASLFLGGVSVFEEVTGQWTETAVISQPDPSAGGFGMALAMSGDGKTLVIGAPEEAQSGAAYLFQRESVNWVQQARLSSPASPDAPADAKQLFGAALALSRDGGVLAVGAPGDVRPFGGVFAEVPPSNNWWARDVGAVHVFKKVGADWVPDAYVKASNQAAKQFFGQSVALSGDGTLLAIGAPGEYGVAKGVALTPTEQGDADTVFFDAGATYTFRRVTGGWAAERYVKASNTDSFDAFGASVSLSADGKTLAVGADGEDSLSSGVGGAQGNPDEFRLVGAAYLYY